MKKLFAISRHNNVPRDDYRARSPYRPHHGGPPHHYYRGGRGGGRGRGGARGGYQSHHHHSDYRRLVKEFHGAELHCKSLKPSEPKVKANTGV